jgi:PAS domain S-box-containing protein
LVLDVVGQGIFTVDRHGCITSFNRAAERITGYDEEEVIGRQCSDVFRTELCRTECPLKQSIKSRDRVQDRELEIQTKDGRSIPVSISTAPLETASGELLGGVEILNDLSPVHGLRRRLEESYRFDDIISKNPEMHRLFSLLSLAAESNSTILITGPSGTGKELVARAVHNHGPRRRKRFVPVNCAALPETLLESELFGYRRGAFTDAKTDRKGLIAKAEGGTLFIDEVGDLPKPLQVKLLRFLQERQYEPLGSTDTVHADIRVIAATNKDLEPLVESGAFRDDLYYRLNVLQIDLPPLSRRAEDIPLLVRHFIDRCRLTTGKPITGITTDALATLIQYSFPGNIRELENIIERAFILCSGSQISTSDLPPNVVADSSNGLLVPKHLTKLEQVEEENIKRTLAKHRGNRTRAAVELGIHRSTLIRKLKRFGLS